MKICSMYIDENVLKYMEKVAFAIYKAKKKFGKIMIIIDP